MTKSGALVLDFNTMASRIEEFISRQRQLISDVPPELRTPLARLNVALDVVRERKGNDPAFEQMLAAGSSRAQLIALSKSQGSY